MSKYNKKSIPVYVNGGKIAGCVRGSVYDVRKHSDLLLHTPPAVAFSVDALHEAERLGAEIVQVSIIETGRMYQKELSQIKQFPKQHRGGYESQYLVPLEYLTVICEGEVLFDRNKPLPPIHEAESTMRQLSMFG